jgi:purine-binding chemotaxis protein CheW
MAIAQPQRYVTFELANEHYGVAIDRVHEIVELPAVTVRSRLPACIRGVCSSRGTTLPVIDLAIKFGYPALVATRWSCLVILDVEHERRLTAIGLWAVDRSHRRRRRVRQ